MKSETKETNMRTVGVSQRIGVSAEVAWDVVRTGGSMDRWAPFITACRLDGEGVGARRVCVISGQELHESIETVDDQNRLFQYRIHKQSMMPLRNILGTIHVSPIGPAESEVLWFVNFEVDSDEVLPAVKEGIQGMYRAGIQGLEAYSKGRRG